MKVWHTILVAAGIVVVAQGDAAAATLTVINVGAPKINCVFSPTCSVLVNDSVGSLTYTPLGAGTFLQSRTYSGLGPTPGAGHTAYEYRIDLTQSANFTDCIAGVVINFGPVAKLPYGANNALGHVFVVVQGGLGTVGIKSAEQDGAVITFTFEKYLCPGQTTYFFGLASLTAPVATIATMFAFGATPFIPATARVPQH